METSIYFIKITIQVTRGTLLKRFTNKNSCLTITLTIDFFPDNISRLFLVNLYAFGTSYDLIWCYCTSRNRIIISSTERIKQSHLELIKEDELSLVALEFGVNRIILKFEKCSYPIVDRLSAKQLFAFIVTLSYQMQSFGL